MGSMSRASSCCKGGCRFAIVFERFVSGQRTAGVLSAIAALALAGCTAARTIIHNFADLDDYRIFANRTIEGGATSRLRELSRPPAFLGELRVPDRSGRAQSLERYLGETRTAAFLVLREDRIVYERYARGYDGHSLFNSFSIAKSIVATLVAIAVSEGRIRSIDDTVADYRPELGATPYGRVTVRRLLTMTSGMADPPSLLPGRVQYYYGADLHRLVASSRPSHGGWRYSEADVQVLGYVLEAAVGQRLSDYLAEKLWKPLGMESRALWALDHEGGMEKAFCCISARARDFARFGLLYLHGGRWYGRQVVPAAWASRSVLAGLSTPDGYTHRHLWWIPEGNRGDYYAYGHNGQYVYIDPATKVVIVKFSETVDQDPLGAFRAIADALDSPRRIAELDRLEAPQVAQQ